VVDEQEQQRDTTAMTIVTRPSPLNPPRVT